MEKPIKPEYRFFAYEYDAVTQRNQANSALLQLPAELRNRIYDFVFDSATLKRDLSPASAGRYRVVPDSPCFISVCRQVRFETQPFWRAFTYHRLTLRMEGKEIMGLVDLVGQPQCAQIVRIDMFQSLACALQRTLAKATLQGPYAGLWAMSGDRIFPELKRIVVTYPIDLADNVVEVGESLQTLFGKPGLEIHFRAATYWGQGVSKSRRSHGTSKRLHL